LRENSTKYGLGPVEDGSVAMARCVAFFCVASKPWIEVIVGRYDQGERELLLQSLAQVKANDVLVLDRGYPAWWLFAAMQLKGADFVPAFFAPALRAVAGHVRKSSCAVTAANWWLSRD
jgi:hypothetical protein